MVFNPVFADKLLQGTGHTATELFALRKDNMPLPHFDLPIRVRAATRMLKTPLESANVVAKLEGSDPRLKNEYVVLSTHIDHVGIANVDAARTQQRPIRRTATASTTALWTMPRAVPRCWRSRQS